MLDASANNPQNNISWFNKEWNVAKYSTLVATFFTPFSAYNVDVSLEASMSVDAVHFSFESIGNPKNLTLELASRFLVDNRNALKDDPTPGHPRNKIREELVEKVREISACDTNSTVRWIAKELNITKDVIHEVLTEDLNK
ncbi:hypothetical protein Trydic_g846 [Trypoxylus dichotomus]